MPSLVLSIQPEENIKCPDSTQVSTGKSSTSPTSQFLSHNTLSPTDYYEDSPAVST
ncbi:hypothetical protein ON05_027230 [Acaryochloris sp. CCMEE 5410]|nr:hypothetical protein ON05_027230 [Acaryochloris sp. CCMEE 5410]